MTWHVFLTFEDVPFVKILKYSFGLNNVHAFN